MCPSFQSDPMKLRENLEQGLRSAASAWSHGHTHLSAQLLTQQLSDAQLAAFAARLVHGVDQMLQPYPGTERILAVLQDPSRWNEARELMFLLRRTRLERHAGNGAALLGDCALKLVFNFRNEGTSIGFDADQPERLVAAVLWVANDQGLGGEWAWEQLEDAFSSATSR